jgi:hypothetical protein
MAKWVIFEDSVNDQHAYPVKNINAIFITSSTSITVYARNPAQPNESVTDDTITLTCTADTVDSALDAILTKMNSEKNMIMTVSISNFIGVITTVAYTAGA